MKTVSIYKVFKNEDKTGNRKKANLREIKFISRDSEYFQVNAKTFQNEFYETIISRRKNAIVAYLGQKQIMGNEITRVIGEEEFKKIDL